MPSEERNSETYLYKPVLKKENNLAINDDIENNCSEKRKGSFSRYFYQNAVAITVCLIFGIEGIQGGWPGPTLVKMKESGTPLSITEGSWLASTNALGHVLGPLLGGYGGGIFGRKKTMLLAVIPIFVGTVITAVGPTVMFLCVGRFLSGLGTSSAFTLIPSYIGEISSPEIRGRLTCLVAVEYNIGLLFEYAIGPGTSVFENGLIIMVFPILFVSIFWWMPESPYFLALSGKEDRVVETLRRLDISDDLDSAVERIKSYVKRETTGKGTLKDLFCIASNRRALIIASGIATANIFTGINAYLSYAQTILSKTSSAISPNVTSMIFAAVGIVTIVLSSRLVDTWGRRPLFMLSLGSTAAMLTILGGYFYLQHIEYDGLEALSLVPAITFIAVKLTISLGASSLQFVCMGELFPTNITSLAAGVIEIYGSILRFGVVKLYPWLAFTFGTHVVIWGFAICCTMSTIIAAFLMPETKKQRLDEINEHLTDHPKIDIAKV